MLTLTGSKFRQKCFSHKVLFYTYENHILLNINRYQKIKCIFETIELERETANKKERKLSACIFAFQKSIYKIQLCQFSINQLDLSEN